MSDAMLSTGLYVRVGDVNVGNETLEFYDLPF
jgi:hypothetical protein